MAHGAPEDFPQIADKRGTIPSTGVLWSSKGKDAVSIPSSPLPKSSRGRLAVWLAFGVVGLATGAVWASGFASSSGANGTTVISEALTKTAPTTATSALSGTTTAVTPLAFDWQGRWGSISGKTVMFKVDLSGVGLRRQDVQHRAAAGQHVRHERLGLDAAQARARRRRRQRRLRRWRLRRHPAPEGPQLRRRGRGRVLERRRGRRRLLRRPQRRLPATTPPARSCAPRRTRRRPRSRRSSPPSTAPRKPHPGRGADPPRPAQYPSSLRRNVSDRPPRRSVRAPCRRADDARPPRGAPAGAVAVDRRRVAGHGRELRPRLPADLAAAGDRDVGQHGADHRHRRRRAAQAARAPGAGRRRRLDRRARRGPQPLRLPASRDPPDRRDRPRGDREHQGRRPQGARPVQCPVDRAHDARGGDGPRRGPRPRLPRQPARAALARRRRRAADRHAAAGALPRRPTPRGGRA